MFSFNSIYVTLHMWLRREISYHALRPNEGNGRTRYIKKEEIRKDNEGTYLIPMKERELKT